MLRIKSAQFQNPIVNPASCKGCQETRDIDDLRKGYCRVCLESGVIKSCPNCENLFHEDEGVRGYCPECGGDFFQFDRGNRLVDTRDPY